eukprot:TRINITY_DN75690_c0_g1_i1.p1 TRINITY_DN75690_c0_g1~~TRINITY_DN75690_c0_g1_i1.p1  ORF type:complete len:540 (+),score=137.83 TRINITY_DN75690_c0_g1_i1:19-1638(+)
MLAAAAPLPCALRRSHRGLRVARALPQHLSRRCFCDSSGARTLANVVQELRRQGKLPGGPDGAAAGPHFSAEPGADGGPAGGFVNIDDALAVEAEAYASPEAGPSEEQGDEAEDASSSSLYSPAAAAARAREEAFEEAALLSEEELRERVRRSIEELVPQGTAGAAVQGEAGEEESAPRSEAELTPAQLFYLENRERLVSRAQEYYLEKQKELQQQREGPEDVEDEWRYYHDPVVRPPKGHLWSTGLEGEGDEHGREDAWLEAVTTWPRGQLPTAEMLADLLRAEQAKDVSVVDLDECGRRDLGTFAVLGTGVTPRHCRRLGHIVSRATQACEVPHVEAFCWGTRNDEWVVAHCGPIKVHLFTRETREEYKLELLWRNPEEFYQFGDFPHYVEVYGTATEAMLLNGGTHITKSLGSRSRTNIPAPFRDELHGSLMQYDYSAAEDASFATPSVGTIDVSGGPVPFTRHGAGRDSVDDDSSESWSGGGTQHFHSDIQEEAWQDRRGAWNLAGDEEVETDEEDEEACSSSPSSAPEKPLRRL